MARREGVRAARRGTHADAVRMESTGLHCTMKHTFRSGLNTEVASFQGSGLEGVCHYMIQVLRLEYVSFINIIDLRAFSVEGQIVPITGL